MAKIDIKAPEARQALLQQELLEAAVNILRLETTAIRASLSYKISGQEAIKARLGQVIEQMSQETGGIHNMHRALTDIISQYEMTEAKNQDRVFPKKISIQSKGSVDYGRPSGKDLLQASNKDKDSFISRFEWENPNLARQLDELLSGGENNKLKKDDIRDIKYLAYNANEPFRSIFLASLGGFTIGDADLNGNAYYRPADRTVNYTYDNFWEKIFSSSGDSFSNDPRGKYTTFFHETGHAIDDISDYSQIQGSDTENFSVYSDSMGKAITLRDAIEYDVYYNEQNSHSITNIANSIKQKDIPGTGSGGNTNNVIAAFQSGDTSRLSNEDLVLYNSVFNQYKATTGSSARYEAVSDIYGAMSNNTLRTGYGHANEYWSSDSTKAAKELWAEYFSYNMAGNNESLSHLLDYFPEAAKVLEQYALSLGG